VLEHVLFVCHSLAFLLFFPVFVFMLLCVLLGITTGLFFFTAFATSFSRCSRRVVCCFSYACAGRVFGLVWWWWIGIGLYGLSERGRW
jgi:hypothetical protein